MATVKVLAVVISMVLGAAAGPYIPKDESCDFRNINLDGAVEKMLEKLPKYKLVGLQSFNPVFAGFEIGGGNISGFSEIRQYGPLLPYCTRVNGTRMLEVNLITVGGPELSIPWRHCSGNEGSIRFRSSLARITTQIRVNVPESGQGVSLSYVGPTVHTAADGSAFMITGAGEIGKHVAVAIT
uniref:Hypothetical secreted protein 790 n=1 Tax=Amblyomma variegatum TaxID=34610 RepID=F0JA82_AMBVA|nr:TPA_inf: hypothetical secreted protein 790 [Amblyomma variegatum]